MSVRQKDDSFKLPVRYEDTNESKEFKRRLDKFTLETEINPWIAYYPLTTVFYIHLLHKYKMNCLLSSSRTKTFVGFYFSFDLQKQTYEGLDAKHIVEQLFKCIQNGVAIITIPLIINFIENGNHNPHANILIYRKKFNTIEHFEPHGKWFNDNLDMAKLINSAIEDQVNYLNSLIQNKYVNDPTKLKLVKFISAEDSCPVIMGFQDVQHRYTKEGRKDHEDGYCGAWSLFFTELALCNPEIQSKDLMDKMYDRFYNKVTQSYNYKKMGDYFLDIIRGYSRMIHKKVLKVLDVVFGKDYITVGQINDPNLWDTLHSEIGLLVDVEVELLNNPHITRENYYTEIYKDLVDNGWQVKENNEELRDPKPEDLKYGTEWIHPNNRFTEKVEDIKRAKIAKHIMKAIESASLSVQKPPPKPKKPLYINNPQVYDYKKTEKYLKKKRFGLEKFKNLKNDMTNRVIKVKSLFKRFFTKKRK